MASMISRLKRFLSSRGLFKKLKGRGSNFTWKGEYIEFPENVIIGHNVYIGPGARIHASGGLEIQDGVICGPKLTVYTYNHNYLFAKYLPYDEVHIKKPVVIERNVWIGDSVSIIPGVTVGEGSIIGMRSVITKNIPPFSIVGGNPAKVIKTRPDIEHYMRINKKENNYLLNKKLKNLVPKYVSKKR